MDMEHLKMGEGFIRAAEWPQARLCAQASVSPYVTVVRSANATEDHLQCF